MIRRDVSFTELHFHLLPGVDDGPRTMAESLELAAAAAADGSSVVIASPHVHPNMVTEPLSLPERVAELNARLREARIPLHVETGGELAHRMVGRLSDEQLEVIAHGPAGRRWVLLECPFAGLDENFSEAADELRSRGFACVLAHPERARPLPGADATLARELARGSILQVNAFSIAGRLGPEIGARAAELLRANPWAVVASDAHNPARPPALRLAVAALRADRDADPLRRIDAVPQALLHRGLPHVSSRRDVFPRAARG
jgi:protein-tyrosine phosphatase